jgi:ubiquinone/menaquinone biosynthesis C-methylase UbiE
MMELFTRLTASFGFDRVARIYRWMEYFSFGSYLQQCRIFRIDEMALCRRALLYGDGDGRFLSELARRLPQIEVAAVDASREMLHQAAQRMPFRANVRLIQADALEYDVGHLPEAPFDLIVTHFFLDCFDEAEIASLLSRVDAATQENALWVVSEFAIPSRNPARLVGMFIVRALYLAFGLLTGLSARRLPDYGQVMQEAGWRLENRRELLFGLLVSERWRRRAFY